jgi:uridine kinase
MATNPQIILIDGPAGSGKTTLSLQLSAELNCQVVHLDDHYNGWDEALGPDLTAVLLQIVENFVNGRTSVVPTFNWHLAKFEGNKEIAPAKTLIIEGVGSGQSQIRPFATKLYWVETEPEIGLARVLERDGADYEERIKVWQIREANHFQVERTREFANFIISTT